MVRKTRTENNLRILDRQDNFAITKSTENSGTIQQDIQEKQEKIEIDIGLDISTSVIGICILENKSGKLIQILPIKLTSTKFEDIWDKALEFESKFKSILTPTWDVKRIFVEDIAKKFSSGFSSAGTIVTLAKMNAIVCFIIFKMLNIKPTFINVKTARAQLGIKIDTKDKTKSTKEKVFEKVLDLNPNFPWLKHIAKTGKNAGQMVYDSCCQDMGDAWIVVSGGQKLYK